VERDADGVDDRSEVSSRRGLFGRRTTTAEDEPLTADRDADGVPDDRERVTTTTRRTDET
jgi:hypothetical protein